MKSKIKFILFAVAVWMLLLLGMTSNANIPEHNAPYGMVKHHKHVKLSNRIHFFKRQHQNRIFQNFLRWDKQYKGKWSESFAPEGQGLF
jgi:hypothetical protein